MSSRRVKALAAVAVVAAAGSPAAGAAPPALAGETVVVVRGATKMQVTVPARAYVSFNPANSFHVSGGGRVVGVLLRENHPEAEEATFLRVRAPLGVRSYVWGPAARPPRCKPHGPSVPVSECTEASGPNHVDLRRGTYTLYAFSEGGPARVTIRVANYRGSRVLVPRTPVSHGTVPFTTGVAAPVVWSGGGTWHTDGPSVAFATAWWKQDDSAAADAGTCQYRASEGEWRTPEWLPGCPGSSSGGRTEVVTPVTPMRPDGVAKGGQHGVVWASWSSRAEEQGVGAWVKAQNVRDGGGLAYWIGR